MKIKRILSLALALVMCAVFFSAAAEAAPVTLSEIYDLAESVRKLALTENPLNDPAHEDARSEAGYEFRYDFGSVYADRTEMTEETVINAFLLNDPELPVLRNTRVGMDVNALLKAIPSDNPDMNGSRETALLYLSGDAENGFEYGRVTRDSQRISAIEYGIVRPADGIRNTVTYQISGDYVISVFVEGLNEIFPAENAASLFDELDTLKGVTGYIRVPFSFTGTDLTPFEEADLDFPALNYLTAQPEQFGSNVESALIDNEDGTYFLRVDGEGFEAIFRCDSRGNDPVLITYSILGDNLEGPRCVRIGDSYTEDYYRFRSGEGTFDEASMSETLYGTPGTAPYGLAEFGADEIILRYIAPVSDGNAVELYLRYVNTELAEIILHTLN